MLLSSVPVAYALSRMKWRGRDVMFYAVIVTMMLPHHQGAVDMAKALLLRTTDPGLRNLAQGMLAEQQIEIQLMQEWLRQHPAPAATNPLSKAAP